MFAHRLYINSVFVF